MTSSSWTAVSYPWRNRPLPSQPGHRLRNRSGILRAASADRLRERGSLGPHLKSRSSPVLQLDVLKSDGVGIGVEIRKRLVLDTQQRKTLQAITSWPASRTPR